jgi:EAL domain-containing protein (putative c-di-GMP-specific phosphodiesterase class I)
MRLHYQPQVDVSGEIQSLEALLRWQHPVKGLILPNDFIAVAEQSGLIVELSRWVITQAFCDMLAIKRAMSGGAYPTVAVNISTTDLRQDGFLQLLRGISGTSGFQDGDLRLELTEHTLMENYEAVIEIMHRAHDLGFSFAIDDFGTGHSSLAYLKRLPVDMLKIDPSFVKDILDDPNNAVIIRTIIGMAGNLGLETVAEGVETAEAYRALLYHGCRRFQGWHFGRPEPLDSIIAQLRHRRQSKTSSDAGIPA